MEGFGERKINPETKNNFEGKKIFQINQSTLERLLILNPLERPSGLNDRFKKLMIISLYIEILNIQHFAMQHYRKTIQHLIVT